MTKDEQFTQNLLRMLCAENYLAALLSVAREMFAKSYFSLGVSEKQVVDQTVLSSILGNYQSITHDLLAGPNQGKTGFQPPPAPTPNPPATS